MATSATTARLWLGPMLLIIIVALIYLLSLMPHSPPPMPPAGMLDYHQQDYAVKGQAHLGWDDDGKLRQDEDQLPEELLANLCQHGGMYNETDGSCKCTRWYTGEKCHVPVCLNDGVYNVSLQRCVCASNWVGEHCIFRCNSGVVNKTTGMCECLFGRPCTIQKCINGQFFDGKCVCYEGFAGPACSLCDVPSNAAKCGDGLRRRGAVNSRLTLSGLSFCIITIGLLCVAARRRRNGMMPPVDDTWYRVFQPAQHRPFRCRHDYFCGGSWIPRDRALIVAPGRVSVNHSNSGSSRSGRQRLATPPPSYTSVDNLTRAEEQMPPTYEEATRVLMEADESAAGEAINVDDDDASSTAAVKDDVDNEIREDYSTV